MLTVKRIDSLEGMVALRKTWMDLINRYPYRNLFLTHEWVVTWWRHFGTGRELYLLLVNEGQRTIGLAPMMISKAKHKGFPVRILGFLSNKHTSRADFILPERAEEAILAIVRYWEEIDHQWDMVVLENVLEECGTYQRLSEILQGSSLKLEQVRSAQGLLYLPISGSWDDYLRKCSKNFRKNVRYQQNKLGEIGKTEFRKIAGSEVVNEAMTKLFDLERRSWKSDDSDIVLGPEDKAFQRELASLFAVSGGDETRFMEVDGQIVGGIHSLIYNKTLYPFLTYYDSHYADMEIGWAMFRNLIEELFTFGHFCELDFNGGNQMVSRWTEHARGRWSIEVYNARLYSRLLRRLKRVKRQMVSPALASGAADRFAQPVELN